MTYLILIFNGRTAPVSALWSTVKK